MEFAEATAPKAGPSASPLASSSEAEASGEEVAFHIGSDGTPGGPPPEYAPRMDEGVRFERLREQDGKPWLPPKSLSRFLVGTMPPQLLSEGRQEWEQMGKELDRGASFGVEERYYFLAFLLYQQLNLTDAAGAKQVLVETAQKVSSERYRQVLCGLLSRLEVRNGALKQASRWFAWCDPYSDDLHIDSAHRMTRAYLATARKDWDDVLVALGARIDDIPIVDSNDLLCALLRAHALEMQGELPAATQQLSAAIPDPGRLALVNRVREANLALTELCPQSFAELTRQMAQQVGSSASSAPPTNILSQLGSSFFMMSLVMGFIFWAVAGFGFSFMTFGMFGIFALVGLAMMVLGKKSQLRDQHLREHGLSAEGQILATQETGTKINGQPLMELTLQIFIEGREPYQATHRTVMGMAEVAQVQQGGASLSLKVDPDDPMSFTTITQAEADQDALKKLGVTPSGAPAPRRSMSMFGKVGLAQLLLGIPIVVIVAFAVPMETPLSRLVGWVKSLGVAYEEVAIPAGSFQMGPFRYGSRHRSRSYWRNRRARRGRKSRADKTLKVTLGHRFAMLKYEVTRRQFRRLMWYAPSEIARKYKPSQPVVKVGWHEALAFSNALSKSKGYTPCYTCAPAKCSSKSDCKKQGLRKFWVRCKGGRCTFSRPVSSSTTLRACRAKPEYRGKKYYRCPGYRLPTEAEWEYAYRAGRPNQDALLRRSERRLRNALEPVAWFWYSGGRKLQPVGKKKPNPWGLYDMAGNAAEWVYDHFSQSPRKWDLPEPVLHPIDDSASHDGLFLVKGGHYSSFPKDCLANSVSRSSPTRKIGFRLVRTLVAK